MPKRTNAFQALITHITEQLTPTGAKVTESVEMEELGIASPAKREIDVLLELEVGVTSTRIALECRDHRRRADVQWIDSLIGKYRNLPIDKVVAVSRSGFTKTAVDKAGLTKIDLMTLEEAVEHPWPSEFLRLGMLLLKQHFELKRILLRLEPKRARVATTDSVVIESTGETGSVGELVDRLRDLGLRQGRDHLKTRMREMYKTAADLEKVLVMEWEVPVSGLTVHTGDGLASAIVGVSFLVHVRSEKEEVAVSRALAADRALVTSASFQDATDPGLEVRMDAVQIAGERTGRVFVEKRARRRSR